AFTAGQNDEIHRILARVADQARIFFAGIPVTQSRARYRAEDLIDHAEDGTMLGGALEGLESTLASMLSGGLKASGYQNEEAQAAGRPQASGDASEDIAALQ